MGILSSLLLLGLPATQIFSSPGPEYESAVQRRRQSQALTVKRMGLGKGGAVPLLRKLLRVLFPHGSLLHGLIRRPCDFNIVRKESLSVNGLGGRLCPPPPWPAVFLFEDNWFPNASPTHTHTTYFICCSSKETAICSRKTGCAGCLLRMSCLYVTLERQCKGFCRVIH